MSMKLIILGLLMESDRHPYEIRQTIKERNWHLTFKLRDGSLYYAVDQLREGGLIEAFEVIPSPGDKRPDKTVYRITEKGKASFLDELYEQMEQPAYPTHPIFIALPFARHGDSDRLAELARKQLESCEARIAHIQYVLELKGSWLPPGAVHMIRGILRFSETERDWIRDLLTDAENGRLAEGKREASPSEEA
ncbi:PadR family transcriptional regulator [Cohnella lupini]|uniref:DNA-binding PadR family transcriptional regulator n=1 Tax=Cohnella lupini TaxID=1294267 RepID=A0A3D9I5P9_9BACL|nr:PadR family transcriptional regulator [Cohnella lupini]RED57113.1 DNA-binding PadR family transcriptional regulator [Cohnella lupini]